MTAALLTKLVSSIDASNRGHLNLFTLVISFIDIEWELTIKHMISVLWELDHVVVVSERFDLHPQLR